MRVLLSLLSAGFLKNFESVVEELARRGHEVDLVVHTPTGLAGAEALGARLTSTYPNLRLLTDPVPRDGWQELSIALRACEDYLYFSDPRFEPAYLLRSRNRTPKAFRRAAKWLPLQTRAGRRAARGLLAAAEDRLPLSPPVLADLRERRPDLAVFTPLIGLSTVQPHWLHAAQALGIPTAVCVASWDHLSSKSRMRPLPDLVTLWNPTQEREAVELHGVPQERIEITGAQLFDHWFSWQPRPRAELCAQAGLDPNRPYLLYTCFSPFKDAPDEAGFVRRWLAALRGHPDKRLRTAGVLVRPHPKRIVQWQEVDLSGYGDVAVWPRDGHFVTDEASKADFFDSLHHSAAVVGLNTSAMIEASIVGRPVHTVLVPEYHSSQEGTLHFRYLVQAGGGVLRVGRGFDEHLDQLASSLRDGRDASAANAEFVRAFVRPHGLDVAGTGRLVDALERLGERGVGHGRGRRLDQLLRRLLEGTARRAAARRRTVVAEAAAAP